MILSFDTSAAHCAAALLSGGRILASCHEEMTKGQAERLMPMITEVLTKGHTSLNQLDAIGVGIGPGNFTGVRISVSAARGLALALGIPAIGVSTLQALAFGSNDTVLCSVDARRAMFYAQIFSSGQHSQPVLCDLATVPLPNPKVKAAVIGHRAEDLAELTGGQVRAPVYSLTEAIARKAAMRMHNVNLPRPAPLYLRAVDAAPARDTGPVLL